MLSLMTKKRASWAVLTERARKPWCSVCQPSKHFPEPNNEERFIQAAPTPVKDPNLKFLQREIKSYSVKKWKIPY